MIFPRRPARRTPCSRIAAHGGAVKGQKLLVVAELAQAPAVLADDFVAPLHFFVEFDAHFENLLEVLLVVVEQLVHVAVADQDDFHVHVDRLRLQRRSAEREEHVHGLDFELAVIQRALQRAPHAGFGERVERVHDQETAVGAQQRTAAQIHEIGIPAAARVVAALDGAEKIRVGGNGLENHRAICPASPCARITFTP